MDSSPAPIKRRGNACKRCRQQKIKCDGRAPSCSNCLKVKANCIKTSQSSEHIAGLESRIRDLESQLNAQNNAFFSNPAYVQDQHHATFKDSPTSAFNQAGQARSMTSPDQIHQPGVPTPASTDSHIGPSQPLAHDVGLLSLGNTGDPKYLGPSSGVTFARLIHAVVPQAQGIPTSLSKNLPLPEAETVQQPGVAKFPEKAELHYFENAYFDVWYPMYPFLDEEAFHAMLERLASAHHGINTITVPHDAVTTMELGQCFLVLALGAQILESRVGNDFGSNNLYAAAIQHISQVPLHDSLRGVQTILLLVLCSFSFPQGGNAWFLLSAIISSCLDLGLQRRQLRPNDSISEDNRQRLTRHENLRSAIFWSGYSLERTLSVILGRPLTLRDEAIDIRFPGGHDSDELDNSAVAAVLESGSQEHDSQAPPAKRMRLESAISNGATEPEATYDLAVLSFRLDRIVAEIKLMVYRVANFPNRFPWPSDNRTDWQLEVHEACRKILSQAENVLNVRKGRNYEHLMHSLTLKYHQCLMILYRPSPAFPEPSTAAMQACYNSAVEILRIHAEMNRFATLINSWLTAHAVFTSGITMLYCLWMSPEVRRTSSVSDLSKHAQACTSVLQKLGKTWSVAESARTKFEKLVNHTSESLRQGTNGNSTNMSGQVNGAAQNFNAEIDGSINAAYAEPTVPNGGEQFETSWDDLISVNDLPGPDMIMDELGDMSTWFDLDWLGDINYANISWS